MGKGFAVTTMIELIIAAVILFLFIPMVFGSAKDVWNSIMIALNIIKPSAMEQAILCSYYRCTKGCADPKILEISWKDPNTGKPIECNSYCQFPKEWNCSTNPRNCYSDTTKLTVCDGYSKKSPIKVEVKNDNDASMLADRIPDASCMYESTGVPHCGCIEYPGVDWTGVGAGSGDNFVYVNKDDFKDTKEYKCYDLLGITLSAIKEGKLQFGTYYVFTDRKCPSWPCIGDPLLTEVSKTVPPTECKPSGSQCSSNEECCSNSCRVVSPKPVILQCA